jgi:hypothetical protein
MSKFRLTLADVCRDMRKRGMSMTATTLADGIEAGVFPFGKVISISDGGIRNILILTKDYEAWADHYLKEETA